MKELIFRFTANTPDENAHLLSLKAELEKKHLNDFQIKITDNIWTVNCANKDADNIVDEVRLSMCGNLCCFRDLNQEYFPGAIIRYPDNDTRTFVLYMKALAIGLHQMEHDDGSYAHIELPTPSQVNVIEIVEEMKEAKRVAVVLHNPNSRDVESKIPAGKKFFLFPTWHTLQIKDCIASWEAWITFVDKATEKEITKKYNFDIRTINVKGPAPHALGCLNNNLINLRCESVSSTYADEQQQKNGK